MNRYNGTAIVLSVCAILIATWAALPRPQQGEWRSSGDGKTIFNATTGEIRFTLTGLTPEQYQENLRKVYMTQQLDRTFGAETNPNHPANLGTNPEGR